MGGSGGGERGNPIFAFKLSGAGRAYLKLYIGKHLAFGRHSTISLVFSSLIIISHLIISSHLPPPSPLSLPSNFYSLPTLTGISWKAEEGLGGPTTTRGEENSFSLGRGHALVKQQLGQGRGMVEWRSEDRQNMGDWKENRRGCQKTVACNAC